MRTKEVEAILDEAICIHLNYPVFALIFPTKEKADSAQKTLFEFYGKHQLALSLEYQQHSVNLIIYDTDNGNDLAVNVPLCEDESSTWFDNKTFNQNIKVALHIGYDRHKTGFKMADYIEGLDEAGIRKMYHFSAKRI
jgi:hypothetical protein